MNHQRFLLYFNEHLTLQNYFLPIWLNGKSTAIFKQVHFPSWWKASHSLHLLLHIRHGGFLKSDSFLVTFHPSDSYCPRYQIALLSKYDVRKIFWFFHPLPPCLCHKSADFVPVVCYLGTPFPQPTADVVYWSPLRYVTISGHERVIICRHYIQLLLWFHPMLILSNVQWTMILKLRW